MACNMCQCVYIIYTTRTITHLCNPILHTHIYIYTHYIHIHYMSYIKKTIYCANEKEERERERCCMYNHIYVYYTWLIHIVYIHMRPTAGGPFDRFHTTAKALGDASSLWKTPWQVERASWHCMALQHLGSIALRCGRHCYNILVFSCFFHGKENSQENPGRKTWARLMPQPTVCMHHQHQ